MRICFELRPLPQPLSVVHIPRFIIFMVKRSLTQKENLYLLDLLFHKQKVGSSRLGCHNCRQKMVILGEVYIPCNNDLCAISHNYHTNKYIVYFFLHTLSMLSIIKEGSYSSFESNNTIICLGKYFHFSPLTHQFQQNLNFNFYSLFTLTKCANTQLISSPLVPTKHVLNAKPNQSYFFPQPYSTQSYRHQHYN